MSPCASVHHPRGIIRTTPAERFAARTNFMTRSLFISLAVVAGLVFAMASACSTSTTAVDPCPGDSTHTVGEYCDEIVPALCRYAVDECAYGDYDTCIAQTNATCWQGNRNRLACTADAGSVAACVYAYAGADASFDGSPPPGTSSGLSCDAVTAGLTPSACQSIVQLKVYVPTGTR